MENNTDILLPENVTVVENSVFARIATWYMRTGAVALVWDRQILLWGVDTATFLKSRRWVRHELKHVEQYNRLGKWIFLKEYLTEWVLKGYKNNRFEVEARQAERASFS